VIAAIRRMLSLSFSSALSKLDRMWDFSCMAMVD
jgi:hypothetical protein